MARHSHRDREVVAAAVDKWIQDADMLLEVFEHLLEQCHIQIPPTASADIQRLLPNLPPSLRHCRAQKPTRAVVALWLRLLIAEQPGGQKGA